MPVTIAPLTPMDAPAPRAPTNEMGRTSHSMNVDEGAMMRNARVARAVEERVGRIVTRGMARSVSRDEAARCVGIVRGERKDRMSGTEMVGCFLH